MTILDQIVATKRAELARAKASVPIDRLRDELASAPPVRDFFGAIATPARRASEGPQAIKLVAEVKKASPSQGVIRADFDQSYSARSEERSRRDGKRNCCCLDASEHEPRKRESCVRLQVRIG